MWRLFVVPLLHNFVVLSSGVIQHAILCNQLLEGLDFVFLELLSAHTHTHYICMHESHLRHSMIASHSIVHKPTKKKTEPVHRGGRCASSKRCLSPQSQRFKQQASAWICVKRQTLKEVCMFCACAKFHKWHKCLRFCAELLHELRLANLRLSEQSNNAQNQTLWHNMDTNWCFPICKAWYTKIIKSMIEIALHYGTRHDERWMMNWWFDDLIGFALFALRVTKGSWIKTWIKIGLV